jgi:excisionase family DNA binding protein
MILFKSDVISNQAQAGILTEFYLTVEAAARQTGYNIQYLRRVLQAGLLEGVKIGQVWLIKLSSLENYFLKNEGREDHRCGPRASCIRS